MKILNPKTSRADQSQHQREIALGNRTKTNSLGRLRNLILEMRKAYSLGQNAMEYARLIAETTVNSTGATMIAYDLQAGTYVKLA